MTDEFPDEGCGEDSEIDDLFVPGIGVRSALADDGPEHSGHYSELYSELWSGVRDRYSHAMIFLREWGIRTFKNVRLVGAREVAWFSKIRFSRMGIARISLSRISDECRTAFSRRPALPAHLRHAHLKRSASHVIWKTHVLIASGTQVAVLRLRSTMSDRVSPAMSRALQASRAHFIRGRQVAYLQLGRAGKHSQQILTEKIRYFRQAQLRLRARAVGARDQLRAAACYAGGRRLVGRHVVGRHFVNLVSIDFRLDRTTLQRAAPALAALLIIAAFVIQATMVAAQR